MTAVCHLITGLGVGGAEMMLYKLLAGSDRRRYDHHVVSLTRPGPMASRIEELGIAVDSLSMEGGPLAWLAGIRRLRAIVDASAPDLVQSWMYHADLLAALAIDRGIPLVWGIRQTTFPRPRWRRPTYHVARFCARLSRRRPARIVCCAETARRVHRDLGYDDAKMRVIPNGFDTDAYRPDPAAGMEMRGELGLAADAPVVGHVARFDPQKDHRRFLRAAAIVLESLPSARFVLCGQGVDGENGRLGGWIEGLGIAHAVHLLGRRDDMPRLLAAFDCLVSSSAYGEGFPNVVGEAMACGTPCVVTDVGDSAAIVGDTGQVVPPGDERALAAAIVQLLGYDRTARLALGERARRRVVEHYGLPVVVRRYEALYDEVLGRCAD